MGSRLIQDGSLRWLLALQETAAVIHVCGGGGVCVVGRRRLKPNTHTHTHSLPADSMASSGFLQNQLEEQVSNYPRLTGMT